MPDLETVKGFAAWVLLIAGIVLILRAVGAV